MQPWYQLNILSYGEEIGLLQFYRLTFFYQKPTYFQKCYNQYFFDLYYEKLGHYFLLQKQDIKYTDKIANLIYLMFNNTSQIKKMMSQSSLNIKKIKINYKKNIKF